MILFPPLRPFSLSFLRILPPSDFLSTSIPHQNHAATVLHSQNSRYPLKCANHSLKNTCNPGKIPPSHQRNFGLYLSILILHSLKLLPLFVFSTSMARKITLSRVSSHAKAHIIAQSFPLLFLISSFNHS